MKFNRLGYDNNGNKGNLGCLTLNRYLEVFDWVALKHPSNDYGSWSISPAKHWFERGSIPDGHAKLALNCLEEVSDHTLVALDGSDGRQLLIEHGFKIVDDPVWYFQKADYIDPDYWYDLDEGNHERT